MRNLPIGIFDSGIGGLTVASSIKKELPNENIIYFGDTKHLPYGEKSEALIDFFSKKIITFLINQKCKAIIIACNSASSVLLKSLSKKEYPVPIFNVIDPVVAEVAKTCREYNIGVIGTKATIESRVYENQINRCCNSAKTYSLATPLLAPMIEEGFINEKISDAIISNYLSDSKLKDIDYLILACTHYPLIYKNIKHYYKRPINVIDSANIVAKYVKFSLKKMKLLNKDKKSNHYFYVSNYTKSFEKSAKFFFQEDIKLQEKVLV